MNSGPEWILALRNLFRNRRRTLSTSVALVVAFVGMSLLAGHVIKSQKSISTMLIYLRHLGHVSVYKVGGIDGFMIHPDQFVMTGGELEQLDQIFKTLDAKIAMSGDFISGPALMSNGKQSIPILVEGVPPELDAFVRRHPLAKEWAPEFLKEHDGKTLLDAVQTDPDSVSISRGVGELLGRYQPLETLSATDKELVLAGRSLEGSFNAVNATIALRHTTGAPYIEDTSVIAPLALVRNLLQTDGASHRVIYLEDPRNSAAVVAALQKQFKEKQLDLEAVPFTDERIGRFYVGIMSFLYVMVSFFTLLIFGASALIIINSMTIGVLERTKEMGTLRALGFTSARVRSLFVKEAVWLSLFSCLAGVVLSQLIGAFINSRGWTYETTGISLPITLRLVMPVWFYVLLSLVMIAISVCAAFVVVNRKTKEKISILLLDTGTSL